MAVLVLSALLALMRGFVAEILSVFAWIGALLLAIYQYPLLEPWITEWTGIGGDLAAMGAGAILFVVAVIVFSILAREISTPLSTYTLGACRPVFGRALRLGARSPLVSFGYLLVQWVLPNVDDRPAWITEAKTDLMPPVPTRCGNWSRTT